MSTPSAAPDWYFSGYYKRGQLCSAGIGTPRSPEHSRITCPQFSQLDIKTGVEGSAVLIKALAGVSANLNAPKEPGR